MFIFSQILWNEKTKIAYQIIASQAQKTSGEVGMIRKSTSLSACLGVFFPEVFKGVCRGRPCQASYLNKGILA